MPDKTKKPIEKIIEAIVNAGIRLTEDQRDQIARVASNELLDAFAAGFRDGKRKRDD